ncbi:helix-turn-helix domain-containing protein [Nocardioides sp.]|uniref:helix-turn-helix domain-containing protein n=1 Tax=Nocardioides sp. TaxID=35761 RepID=UPI0035136B56
MSKAPALPARKWLNRIEAAQYVGLSPDTILRLKRAGKITAKRTAARGGKDLYSVESLDAWVDSLEDS